MNGEWYTLTPEDIEEIRGHKFEITIELPTKLAVMKRLVEDTKKHLISIEEAKRLLGLDITE